MTWKHVENNARLIVILGKNRSSGMTGDILHSNMYLIHFSKSKTRLGSEFEKIPLLKQVP